LMEETVLYETTDTNDVILTNPATEDSILFPASGFRLSDGGSVAYDTIGYYWTSDASAYYDNAGTVFLFSGGINIASFDYNFAASIRCVENNN